MNKIAICARLKFFSILHNNIYENYHMILLFLNFLRSESEDRLILIN